MARYLIERNMHPEQIQDFIPLPLTLSGAMYHTQRDPFSGKPLYVAKTFRERKMQRALIQYRHPANRPLIRKALKALGAEHLTALFFKRAKRKSEPDRKKRPSGEHRGRSGRRAKPAAGQPAGGRRKNALRLERFGCEIKCHYEKKDSVSVKRFSTSVARIPEGYGLSI